MIGVFTLQMMIQEIIDYQKKYSTTVDAYNIYLHTV